MEKQGKLTSAPTLTLNYKAAEELPAPRPYKSTNTGEREGEGK